MTGGSGPGLETALALFRAQRFADAEAACRAVLAADPDCGQAWERLAFACDRLGRPTEAIAYLEEAIRRLADPGQAHHNLAVLLQQQGDNAAALVQYRRAIAAGCDEPLLHSNLGCLLRELGQMQASADELSRAVDADPALAHAQSNLGVTLCLQARVTEGLAHLRLATVLAPDWSVGWSNLLLCCNYDDQASPAQVAAAHRLYGQRFAAPTPAPGPAERATEPGLDPERRLRVGLLSPDFRQHSVAYFLEPLLEARDRQRVAYFAYAALARADGVTARLQRHVEGWRVIERLSDDDAAALMRADRLDVLIDLAGHTAHNRLGVLAQRPAPVQMTYLGYPNTTGLSAVDWRITDRWADPPGLTEAWHSERLLRLPEGFVCYRPPADSPPVDAAPADPARPVTFATFNQLAKISPRAIALWGRVLGAVPGARLLIKGPAFADPDTRAAFARRLASSPLGGHRVHLLPPNADQRDHLAAYGQVDIALDTTPYGGTTTTCEALWMGVPVVTLAGATHAARVGVSLLSRAGLPELVASGEDDYVRIAAALAADPHRLQTLRVGLRRRMTAAGLTDAPRFARGFESALRQALSQRRQRTPPPALPPGAKLLPMTGGVQVAVGDVHSQITAYVLAEQQDWFEDEIAFVRAAINRGDRAIDVGANHGVYTLALASGAGDDGHVWAFEPEPTAAARLAASIAANRLSNVTLSTMALGDHSGPGRLSAGAHSELATLSDAGASGDGHLVSLTTLDQATGALGIKNVAFVKIDAEGAEPAILDGGRAFLARESPLLMFEVRHGATIHRPTIDAVASLNYACFRLVPGLMLLAPAGDLDALDPFQLNLFACRSERAEALAARGLLVTRVQAAGAAPARTWLSHLRPLAIAQAVGIGWRGPAHAHEKPHFAALDHYALAQRPLDPPGGRLAHLMKAIEHEAQAMTEAPSLAVLQTMARLAWEAGLRAVAVQTLSTLVSRCLEGADLDPAIPFLPACPRFDRVALVDGDLRRWILAAALEQRERLRAFSSFYTARDPVTRETLEIIATLGYQSPEMARRLMLVKSLGV